MEFRVALMTMTMGAGLEAPAPPTWPPRFHLMSWQTDADGGKAVNNHYYDWLGGRSLIEIASQALDKSGKGLLWDYERQDGMSFYYTPMTRECRTVEMGVGLLPPDWLPRAPAARLMSEGTMIGNLKTNAWTKGESDTPGTPFITYYAEQGTNRPVRFAFYTGMVLDVITFDANGTLPEADWIVPDYCLKHSKEPAVTKTESSPRGSAQHTQPDHGWQVQRSLARWQSAILRGVEVREANTSATIKSSE
mmetsp:Transcript_12873/g.38865  ORF Transcript_12873/g.38865 Transcript_12873/m.38865 type:complete len:249 (+) Transcript_12873:109-855(+)